MKRFTNIFIALCLAALWLGACVPLPAATGPAATAGEWQTYTDAAVGYSIQTPQNWESAPLPDQKNDGAIHGRSFIGPEGGVEVYWGTGFGGACPEGTMPVQLAQGEAQACHATTPEGTEVWSQIGYQVEGGNDFSVRAYTTNADPASHDLILQVLGTLTFMPPAEPEAQAAGITIQPLSMEVCDGQAQAMAHALDVLEVTQSEAPLNDPVTGASGTGCQATVTGTGEQFGSPDAPVSALGGMLEEQGWTQDPMLAAGGPTGIGQGYRKGDQICWASAQWQPDAATQCPADQPISACEVPPEHQVYTVTLNCGVETMPEETTGAVGMANPASVNCEKQGGTLAIEERGDGGQFGVCYFEDNLQCEEWALLRGECPVGGVKVTGYTTPAGRYCAITGGTYAVTANSGQADEQGTCTLPGGVQCDATEFYNGACDASTGKMPNISGLTLTPPIAEVCNGMAQALSEALSRASTGQALIEVTQAAEPVPMTDMSTGAEGTACRAQAAGTGEEFASPSAVMDAISDVLTGGGWEEDKQAMAAGGPTGEGWGFHSGDLTAMAVAMWLPDSAANCPEDQPIPECKLTPSQQLYTVTLDTAQTVEQVPVVQGVQPAPAPKGNPATTNCINVGGTPQNETRPDGGQYGVCTFRDNYVCEQWALLHGECPVGGVKVTGYNTPAARYCAITGGTYTVIGVTNTGQEAGSCTLPSGKVCDADEYYAGACSSSSPAPAPPTAVPPIGKPNPASQYCESVGGTLKIEQRDDVGEIGVCYFADNKQCEEWALLRGDCPVGGVKVTGYVTPAGRYCAITGGTYTVTGNSGQADEQGTCAFQDGGQCDADAYYNGQCDASTASAPAATTETAATEKIPLKDAVADMDPQDVWQDFYDLTQIPRPSHHEEQVRDFLVQFGQGLGLETIVDEVGNVIIRKPAAAGMENRHGVILQAHMDMVPQKTPESDHDFLTDPIDAYSDGTWVMADGTTLGADDGSGVAIAMAILASDSLALGPIEALFTVNEEDGMDGADGLQPGVLQGDTLINLDSEEVGVFTIGSAGGEYLSIQAPYAEAPLPTGMTAYTMTVSGLQGGHSGVEINEGLGHATKLLVRLLDQVAADQGVRVARLSGGTAANAIPREADALVVVPAAQADAFLEAVQAYEATVQTELAATEPDLVVQATPIDLPENVMDEAAQKTLIAALYGSPQGVLRMSDTVDDLVETSVNMGIVTAADGQIAVTWLSRTSVDSEIVDVRRMLSSVWELAGIEPVPSGTYGAWTPNTDSPILLLMEDAYKTMYNETPEVSAIHAGLECGTIAAKYPGMDAISIGPTLQNVHTPNERMEIASVKKLNDFLIETLKEIPEK